MVPLCLSYGDTNKLPIFHLQVEKEIYSQYLELLHEDHDLIDQYR